MSGGSTKVLYIAGSGRSGTTLLGLLLGQAKGFCFVGEAMYGVTRLETRLCGCGVPLLACDFWTTVRREAGGGTRLVAAPEFFRLGALARWRHLPLTFASGGERRLESLYGEHWHDCERLYQVVAATSGAEVIVDSSKAVPYLRMLSLQPALELYVVHLVRDARAVAYSWQRLKPAPDRFDSPYLKRHPRGTAAILWLISNVGVELFGRRAATRFCRLRYEDLLERPRESVDRILRMVTGRPVGLPFVGDRVVDLRATHSVSGNPDRLATGPVELRRDDEWTTRMSRADHRVVTALTWPLLARYGYLRAPARGEPASPRS